MLVGNVVGRHRKALVPLLDLRAHDTLYLPDLIRQTDRLCIQRHLAGLDFAHIQHIVNQAQQMLAGLLHLPNIGVNLRRVILVVGHQLGDAHDGIHRRANIMGHVGQEVAFCAAGLPGRLLGLFCRGQSLRQALAVSALGIHSLPLLPIQNQENKYGRNHNHCHREYQDHPDGHVHHGHRIGRHMA